MNKKQKESTHTPCSPPSRGTIRAFQQRALEIASTIDPHATAPNPRVACVILNNGEIIAEGVHPKYGMPHAEPTAFALLPNGEKKDYEVYITLEPCDYFEGKKTPSCTELLIEQKPKKVYIGSVDPHFSGKNCKKLKDAGIEVEILNDGIHQLLNPFFEKHIKTKKPYITLKVAQSLDGKITNLAHASDNPEVQYLTNKKSLKKVHEMRAQYSAILTTTQTILADNPQLNTRLDVPPAFPKRGARGVFSDPRIIILGKNHLPKTLNIFQQQNREIFQFPDFQSFWESELATKTDSVMTECGGTLNTYLLQNEVVEEIQCFVAPKIIGGKNTNSFIDDIDLNKFKLKSIEPLDSDVLMVFTKEM